MKMLQNVLKY